MVDGKLQQKESYKQALEKTLKM